VEKPGEEQVAAWYPRLFRTALRLSGSREDASDLTQEAFRKAFLRWEDFDGRSRATTWLHGILVNCVRDWARRRSVRRAEELKEWDLPAEARDGNQSTDRLDREEELRFLREAIDELDDKLRRPFVAAVLDGYTYDEIADLLSIPVGTVGFRVHQARQEVRRQMLRLFPEE